MWFECGDEDGEGAVRGGRGVRLWVRRERASGALKGPAAVIGVGCLGGVLGE